MLVVLSIGTPLALFSYDLHAITYITITVSTAIFGTAYFMVSGLKPSRHLNSPDLISTKLFYTKNVKRIAYTLIVLGQIAFTLNIHRVLSQYGFDAYWTVNSKTIELSFGTSTIVNYIFFLNIIGATLLATLRAREWVKGTVWFLIFVVTLELGLTGIKSTVLFGVCIVLFSYLAARPSKTLKTIIIGGGLLTILVLISFAFVNVGTKGIGNATPVAIFEKVSQQIRGYVYYNYINLDLELTGRNEFTWGSYTFFFITKLFNPGVRGYFDRDDLILLDPNYNMGTWLREYYVDFSLFGVFFIPLLLGVLCGLVKQYTIRNESVGAWVASGVLMTASAFVFFGNQFVRLQFLYIIVLGFAVHLAAKKIRVEINGKKGRYYVWFCGCMRHPGYNRPNR